MEDVRLLSDEELVTEVRTKNKELYAELVKRYEDKLMRYAMYLLHNEQQALDVVQESFIKAYINLQGFDTKKKFSSWLYRIVHNEGINSTNKYKKEVSLIQAENVQSNDDIEYDFSKKETIEKVHLCLDNMPLLYREPLALHFLEEKSYEEISDILRIPMGTVATRINRAKNIMKVICQRNK